MSSILKVLETRDYFFRFKDHIKEHTLSKEVNTIIKDIKDYYIDYPTHDKVNWDIFSTWFKTIKHHSYSSDKLAIFSKIFSNLEKEELSTDDILPLVESFIERDYAIRMTDHLVKLAQGDDTKDIMTIHDMMKDYEDESSKALNSDEWLVSSNMDEVYDDVLSKGLHWRLAELNRSVGPIRKGDFLVVAARVDTGKTTFLASEVTAMASQLPDDETVLWFNNEERGAKVQARVWSAAAHMSDAEIKADKVGAVHAIKKGMGSTNKVAIYYKPDMSIYDVEKIIGKYKPGLIIFDQLWKVQGFDSAFNETDKMTKLFGWARGIAQKHAPVINVHQAGSEAAGEQYIEMHQLYASKTGIQGEADAIITIGRSFDTSIAENARFLYVPKNKLSGDAGTVESERNGRYEVFIDTERARYTGVY